MYRILCRAYTELTKQITKIKLQRLQQIQFVNLVTNNRNRNKTATFRLQQKRIKKTLTMQNVYVVSLCGFLVHTAKTKQKQKIVVLKLSVLILASSINLLLIELL